MSNIAEEIKKQLTVYDVIEICGIATIKDKDKPYTLIHCCFHSGDEKPSLSLFKQRGTFKCFACGKSGDVINLYCLIKHIDFKTALKELADKLGLKTYSEIPRRTKTIKPKAIINLEENIEQFHQGLLQNQYYMQKFQEKRHLDIEYIKKKKIGFNSRMTAFTIPIYDINHNLVNIRYHKAESKDRWGMKNHSVKLLYDITSFNHKADYVFIVEGEGDFWTTEHLLKANTITTIGGVETLPELIQNNMKLFKDKEITLLLDNDEPARKTSAKIRLLLDEKQKVRMINWEKMKFPKGFDVSDFIIRNKKTLEELLELAKPYSIKDAEEFLRIEEQIKIGMKEQSNPILEKNGVYVRKEGDKEERISSFIIKPKAYIEVISDNIGQAIEGYVRGDIISYDGHKQENILFPPTAFQSKQSLVKFIANPMYVFKGSDKDVSNITERMKLESAQRKEGIKKVGFYKDYYVMPNACIGKEGIIDEAEVEYISQGAFFDNLFKIRIDGFEETVSKIAENILFLNETETMIQVVGWFISCYYKEQIKAKISHFPILTFFGSPESGKTHLAILMWRLFGVVTGEELMSASSTEFTVMNTLSSTKTVPIIIDELKWTIGKEKIDFWKQKVRSVYNGEIEMRGKPDLSVVKYRYEAPLVLCGEMNVVKDVATTERTIQITLDRSFLSSHKDCQDVYFKLRSLPLESFMPNFVVWLLNEDFEKFDENWKKAREELQTFQIPPISSRVFDNMSVIVFGIYALKRFLQYNGEDLPFDRDDLRKALSKLVGTVLTIKGRTKNPLDEFIESIGILIKEEKIKSHRNYIIDGNLAYIHFNSCVPIFKRWAREHSFDGETLDKKEYLNLVREMTGTGYILKQNYVKRFGETMHRTIEIDLKKARDMGLDVSGYGVSDIMDNQLEGGEDEHQ
jgi:5S rRNA maturation endonuclease (ribonuclease M5)